MSLLSLDCLVERFVFELGAQGKQGIIFAESRNSILDNQLELAFLSLKVQGISFVSTSKIKQAITQIVIRDKRRMSPACSWQI
jgi:hypothetical protein